MCLRTMTDSQATCTSSIRESDLKMKLPWKIAVPILCIALISWAVVTRQAQRAKTNELKLAQDATVCRIRAEQGDAEAEAKLGSMYSHGLGVPQDYAEALRWYHKAADQGYAKAQHNLGNMYYYGRGVPQDRGEAERWYHKAADQGDEYARRALGLK